MSTPERSDAPEGVRDALEREMLDAWDRSAPPEMRLLPPQCRIALAAAAWRVMEQEREKYTLKVCPICTVTEVVCPACMNLWSNDILAQETRNRDYYRGLVVRIGEGLGEAQYIADDGSKQEDVLCAKVPELVAALQRRLTEQAERLGRVEGALKGVLVWVESPEVKQTFSRMASISLTHRHLGVPIEPSFGRWAKEKWDDARAALASPEPKATPPPVPPGAERKETIGDA